MSGLSGWCQPPEPDYGIKEPLDTPTRYECLPCLTHTPHKPNEHCEFGYDSSPQAVS